MKQLATQNNLGGTLMKKVLQFLSNLKPQSKKQFQPYYSDNFWAKNELQIMVFFDDEGPEGDTINVEKELQSVLAKTILGELTDTRTLNSIDTLKQQIISFFNNKYGYDVSEKISQISKFVLFKTKANKHFHVLGKWDNKTNVFYLNKNILRHKSILKYAIVHEIFHQCGISEEETRMLCEGLVELLVQEFFEYIGEKPPKKPAYLFSTMLTSQIRVVDHELVHTLLSGKEKLADKINNRLSNVPQGNQKIPADTIAENLNLCLILLEYGIIKDVETQQCLFMQAQNIIACYCKTFGPTEEEIAKIRSNYFWANYERLKMTEKGNAYILELEN